MQDRNKKIEKQKYKDRQSEARKFKDQLIFCVMSRALILALKILNWVIFLVETSNLFQLNMAAIPKEASRERVDLGGTEKNGLLRV